MNKSCNKIIGSACRIIRKYNDLPMRRLAEQIGCSIHTIQMFETGRNDSMTIFFHYYQMFGQELISMVHKLTDSQTGEKVEVE